MIHGLSNFYKDGKDWLEIQNGTTSIGAFCDIGSFLGNYCKIQTGVSIPPGWTIGNHVFIGPGARFANDKHPMRDNFVPQGGIVEDDVVIGMGALIGPGVKLGKGCVVGMGAVVLKDVPKGETVVGNPAHEIDT